MNLKNWPKKIHWRCWLGQQGSHQKLDRRLNFWLAVLLHKLSYARAQQRCVFIVIALSTLIAITNQPAISANPSAVAAGGWSRTMETLESDLWLADSQPTSLLIHGQRQYSTGMLSAALQTWQRAAEQADDQPTKQAIILSYVSIAAQDLGDWSLATDAIARSQSLLSAQSEDTTQATAQVLNVQGRLALKQGQPERAWEIWQQAEAAYTQADDRFGRVGAQINQSQALQTMGLYRRARLQLEDVAAGIETQPDSEIKAISLKSLGDVFHLAGDLTQSEQSLRASLDLYQQLGDDTAIAETLLSLANTLRLMGDTETAEQNYVAAEALVPSSVLSTKIRLNRFSLLLETDQWQSAQQLLPELIDQIESLPASRPAIYAKVNLVESLMTHKDADWQPMTWLGMDAIASLLKVGTQQAELLGDGRAQSFALGELSELYGYAEQWSDSQTLAQRALSLSQRSNARDIAYRWQRQLGKAYVNQGKPEQAIDSYTAAVDTLEQVRRDLLATNSDVQFSFKQTVEPVYRELISLLLLPEDASQAALSQARNVTEELQLAELENYFRSACVDSATEAIDKLDDQAAALYPIILKDRVEVILSTPGGPLQHYRTWQTEAETNQTINGLYRYLNPILPSERRLNFSKQIYDWLIAPAEADLEQKNIQTLVFVLDGQFRRIPMSALYDGQHYLLEKYGVALTPGLRLLGPHFQNPKPLKALMLGLTEARGGFSALPGVKTEIEQISNRVNTEVIFNEDFTKEKLAAEISRIPFPVLHLATHGQFSSDLSETFLLAWDERISVGDLDGLLRSRREQSEPIELMVLSACETAEGDDRAALGLAGMAIRSGARSTLATLWSVNDTSTAALMTEFYQELSNAELTKSEALRRAQIKILQNPDYAHPYYWSAFVLIGNWLS